MARKSRKAQGFTLVELLVVIAIIAILVALLLPAVNAAREAARRNGCTNNVRQIALAIINHESALQKFPVATDNRDDGVYSPLCATAVGQGGYSWMVKTLPYIEEQALYDSIADNSLRFNTDSSRGGMKSMNPNITIAATGSGTGLAHASTAQLTILQCPSFAGLDEVEDSATVYGVPNVAIGNYCAAVGTNFDPVNSGLVEENGALVSGYNRRGKGRGIGELADGVSKTVLIVESKEERVGSWYDGESAWVTAMYEGVYPNGFDATRLPILTGSVSGNPSSGHALNFGPDDRDGGYSTTFSQVGRLWGPSSDHTGGIVIHGFADNHVIAIPTGSDARVIYAMYTANGGESVSEGEL